jgi:hypothetical protein
MYMARGAMRTDDAKDDAKQKRAAVSGGFEVDNREASNRVDRKPLECPMKDIPVIVEKA